jgi:hypothetical protein
MVTMTYPPDKATEIGKTFMGLPKLPSFVKLVHVLLTAAGESGIKSYTLYEIENKKAYEGLMAIGNRYVLYNNIDGFRYRLEPLVTAEEALPMLGLTPP